MDGLAQFSRALPLPLNTQIQFFKFHYIYSKCPIDNCIQIDHENFTRYEKRKFDLNKKNENITITRAGADIFYKGAPDPNKIIRHYILY
jgi:hypothetical protein